MHPTKQAILQKYGLSPGDLIRKGMEAEVYALNAGAVLKLYPGTISLAHLTALRDFYASLDPSALSYALPSIQMAAQEGEFCLSIERRLPGAPMSALLPNLSQHEMDGMLHAYLAAAFELARMPIPPDFERYKLFDAEGLSRRAAGDWHRFLSRYLAHKLEQVSSYLEKDVADFSIKVNRLYEILSQPYTGSYHLIHGDFFPGNILLDARRRVAALLDFGLLTMYGDPLFDIATACVFFDMYDALHANLRERLLALALETLGESARGSLYRYILLYSVFSANTYSPNCADGHYRWCVANLNNQEYWDKIE